MPRCLPVELMHIILGHLQPAQWLVSWPNAAHNKKDLAACSLVSKYWNAVTRSHLFQDVVYSFRRVPAGDQASYEGQICEHDVYRRFSAGQINQARYKTLRLFCDFLRTDEVARTSIHRLRLRVLPSARRISMFGSSPRSDLSYDEQDSVEAEELTALLGLLPNLRVLNLFDVVPSTPRSAAVKSTKLQQLTITFGQPFYHLRDRNQWSTYSEFAAVHLLRFFDEVEDVQLARIGFDHSSSYPDIPQTPSHPLGIRSLTLSTVLSHRGCLLDRLASSTTLPSLHRLVLAPHELSLRESHTMQTVLALTNGNLLELKYDLSTTLRFDANIPVIDISRCRNLRKLTIGLRVDANARYSNADVFRNIASFLCDAQILQSIHPHLTVIICEFTFVLTLNPREDWQSHCHEDMLVLDQTLLELVSLRPALELQFRCRTIGRYLETNTAHVIKRMFPGTLKHTQARLWLDESDDCLSDGWYDCDTAVDAFL